MAWVRLHDGAMSHPKISRLSDKAFRLWVWGLSYAQLHLTDGRVVSDAPFPARLARAIDDLLAAGLWTREASGDFQIHDYLDWNDSKADVSKKRTAARVRMSDHRGDVRERTTPEHIPRTFASNVPCGSVNTQVFTEKEHEKKPSPSADIGVQSAWFCDRFVALYQQHRNGAHYHLKPSLDWTRVCDLLRTWDLDRLEKLAVVLLTSDEEWIAKTDRGIGVFASRASWCDDRLKAWETEHGVTA